MSQTKNIFESIPLLRFVIPFFSGIFVAEYIQIESSVILLPWVLILPVVLYMLFKVKASTIQNKLFGISIFISLLYAGFSYSNISKIIYFNDIIPKKGIYSGVVLNKSFTTKNRLKLTLKADFIKNAEEIEHIDERIIVYCSDSSYNQDINPGKRITFYGNLNKISNRNNPGDFDYQKFISRKGIRYQSFVNDSIIISNENHRNLLIYALNIRERLLNIYKKAGISGDEFNVLAALTLGESTFISNDIKNSYIASGTMHVLAVSGLHVAIIYLIIAFLLKPLNKNKNTRLLKIVIIICFLWFYGLLSGLSPSVMRSCAMFSFIVIGENLNRQTDTYNTLAASALTLILINPLILFDVGFQLSYFAVISIIFFQPRFADLITTKNKVVRYIFDLFIVSIVAQIGTTPLSIYYFHQFPTYFLISNFLTVPVSGIVLYIAFAFFFLYPIPYLSNLLAIIMKLSVRFMNLSVKMIEELPGSVIEKIWISDASFILIYVLIIASTCFIILRKNKYLFVSLISILILISIECFEKYTSKKQNLLIIYNNYKEPLASFISGNRHYYYNGSDSISDYCIKQLKTVSGKYGTSDPEALIPYSIKCYPVYAGKNDLIYFKGLYIDFNNSKIKKEKDDITDLSINWKKMEIVDLNNIKSDYFLYKKQPEVKFPDTIKNHVYNLKNEGSFILEL
ncbi:MAG: ComEC family competence protein [Prolixibacteraceae bacterium]|nr:ComEC family competence protein [Prolixibacteraceae bacterium]